MDELTLRAIHLKATQILAATELCKATAQRASELRKQSNVIITVKGLDGYNKAMKDRQLLFHELAITKNAVFELHVLDTSLRNQILKLFGDDTPYMNVEFEDVVVFYRENNIIVVEKPCQDYHQTPIPSPVYKGNSLS